MLRNLLCSINTAIGITISTALIFAAGSASAGAACEADGDVEFLCGPVSPEDLAIVPQSPWIIAAGMEDDGFLYLLNRDELSSTVIYPRSDFPINHDRTTYSACAGPVSEGFRPHGLNLREGADQRHTLYTVRHGARESIEVFEIDASTNTPSLTWVGCIVAPDGIVFNSVVALPQGGVAATNFALPEGELWEWHGGSQWSMVPGSEAAGPNGIEVSPNGEWFYIAGWASKTFIRLSRGKTPVEKETVAVNHHIDNIRWAPDGTLLAAGHDGSQQTSIFQCMQAGACDDVSSRVTRVNPQTLATQQIVNYPSNEFLILGTVAIQVGDEIWMGGIAGADRIARFPITE